MVTDTFFYIFEDFLYNFTIQDPQLKYFYILRYQFEIYRKTLDVNGPKKVKPAAYETGPLTSG